MTEKKNISENILKFAVDGIEARERDDTPIDEYLDSNLSNEPLLRGAVTNLLFSYYRNKAVIDSLIKNYAPKIKNAQLRVSAAVATQIFFMDGISPESAVNIAVSYSKRRFGFKPSGFINAVMRKVAKTDYAAFLDSLKLERRLSACPELVKRWSKSFSREELQSINKALSAQPPMTFRALKPLPESELEEVGAVKLELPEWSGNTQFYSCTNISKVIEKGWTDKGMVYIQDPATALAPGMATPEEDHLVLDMCAAPGGKSLMLAEKVRNGNLTACDKSAKRQQKTRENFDNTGSRNQIVVASALEPPFQPESFDLILLDVPCSNTGVGRHRPDAMWSFSEHKLNELKLLQRKILDKAFPLLKPGGQLIYSTCSIETEENLLQVQQFISDNPEFTLENQLQLLPGSLHDGAYAASLRKKG